MIHKSLSTVADIGERVVVYTAIFGGYDDPPFVKHPDPEISYVLFSDVALEQVPPPWQVKVVTPVFTDPQRDARRVKLLPHQFVPEFEISIWMDANCELLNLTRFTVLELLQDADVALSAHLDRSCVFDEAEAVLELQLDSKDRVTNQMATYRAAGFPPDFGLHATMFLMRRHNSPEVRRFSEAWWRQLHRHSKRDQLSFDFVRWKSPVIVKALPVSYSDNPMFRWPGKHKLPSRRTPEYGICNNIAEASPALALELADSFEPCQSHGMFEQETGRICDELADAGFAEPVMVFSKRECAWILGQLQNDQNEPADWFKGRAVTSRAFYNVAVDWRILSHVFAVLGKDVILWGATLVNREPGQVHPWHSDIENSAPSANTVSVWIGLRGTQPETSLMMAPGSHRFGITLQEVAFQKGKRRSELCDADAAAWSRERGAMEDPRLVPMQDGEALFFDGKTWHGSNNRSPELARTALLLQYATAETSIRIPEFGQCEWPFRFLERPQPPCLLVNGRDRVGVNRIVPAPLLMSAADAQQLHSGIHAVPPFLPGDDHVGMRSYHLFHGFTAVLADFSCHISVLNHGKCPHPPHQHPEEEILLVLSGEVEQFLPDLECQSPGGRVRLGPGNFAYLPAGCYHTLTAISKEPARYLMLKWYSDPSACYPPLRYGVFDASQSAESMAKADKGVGMRFVFDEPTQWLGRLHCHVTVLDIGSGYVPHADEYDVIIIMLEGEVEIFGKKVCPFGVIFCAAGEPHGIRNTGSMPARYLVFELRGGKMAARRLALESSWRGQ